MMIFIVSLAKVNLYFVKNMTKKLVKIIINYSPNFTTSVRNRNNIKYLIYHYTGMRSESKAISRLTDVKSKVSCHYFIKRNGLIISMVPDLHESWHAGKSNWRNYTSLNKNSIGIEISNRGHRFGYQSFSKKQIKSIISLSKYLIKKYHIKKEDILGHSDIAYERKIDPGEKFPWEFLSKKHIGLWHTVNKNKLKKIRKKKTDRSEKIIFFKFLSKIGYSVINNKYIKQTKLIKNFQRHFRQKLIDGIIDQETLLIAKNLSKFKKK